MTDDEDEDKPGIIDKIHECMDSDEDRRSKYSDELMDLYEGADDHGKALIDWALIHLCGYMLPTLKRMVDESDYGGGDMNDEQKAATARLRKSYDRIGE
jgi:hypothetical protein